MSLRDQILAALPGSVASLSSATGAPVARVECALSALVRAGRVYRLRERFFVAKPAPTVVTIQPVQRRKPPEPWRCAKCGEADIGKRSPHKPSYCAPCRLEQMRVAQRRSYRRKAHETRVLRDQLALYEARVRELEAQLGAGA